jgi:hypothetical protein
MVNNGYNWFTMYLDRFDGEKVLTEVRLIAPISWEYAKYDVIVARVTGELGKGVNDYGPKDGPLEGENDYGNYCIPVRITDDLDDVTEYRGEVAIFSVDFNSTATTPVAFAWYQDGVLIEGETGPNLNFTVPTIGSILEEQTVTISVNVSNECGSDWSSAILTIPADPACSPYSCEALREEMRYQSQITGFGVWDLMDPNYTSTIPEFFRRVSTATGPGNLTSDATGATWERTGLSQTTLNANDADLCDPLIMRNTDSAQEEFRFSDRPTWGAMLPNIAMAVVVRNVDVGSAAEDPDNTIFEGAASFTSYTQTGTTTGSLTHRIQIARSPALDSERVYFNLSAGSGSVSFVEFPSGYFSSSVPVLLEVVLEIDDVWFPASSVQTYVRDSYDWMVAYTGKVWATRGDTLETIDGAVSVTYRASQVFSLEGNNPEAGTPMPQEYLPRTRPSALDYDGFLQGGIGGMYNLSINGVFGGEGDDAQILTAGYSAGRVGSSIHTSFARNYEDYTQPGYCSLPENTTRVRRRT